MASTRGNGSGVSSIQKRRRELGNGLALGGEPYPYEIRFGALSPDEQRRHVAGAEEILARLDATPGTLFERWLGRNFAREAYGAQAALGVLFLALGYPLIDAVIKVLNASAAGSYPPDLWAALILLSAGYLLSGIGMMIAMSTAHTHEYWLQFLELVRDPETRDILNFTPDRPLTRMFHLSGWFQAWGILSWLAGALFWR